MKRMGIVAVMLAALALGNHPATAQPATEPPASPPAASDAPAAQPAPPPSPPSSTLPASPPSPPSSTLPASPPSPVPRPPASSATPPASSFAFGRRPSRDEVSAAREACRQQANTQELSGSERAKFLRSCFAAKMPAVVRRAACRKEAKARGHVQAGLRAYIRQCMARQRGV
jgi:hypothetical protein